MMSLVRLLGSRRWVRMGDGAYREIAPMGNHDVEDKGLACDSKAHRRKHS